uniref:Doublecortin domain-containing protein n=1 Tax=Heterorhabditis bacteriophora TaxID=37862 RepID=A0A1I7WRG2_HETBA
MNQLLSLNGKTYLEIDGTVRVRAGADCRLFRSLSKAPSGELSRSAIVEVNKLRVAYKDSKSLVFDVRVYVGTIIEYPADEVSLIRYSKERLLGYDQYCETLEYLLNRLKENNKAFKQGIMIEKKLLLNGHKVIEEREPIMNKMHIKEDTSRSKQVDDGSALDYSTSDEESDSSIRGITTRITEEKRIKSHRNEDLPPTNQAQYTIGECVNTD